MKKCSNCGSLIRDGQDSCKFCGASAINALPFSLDENKVPINNITEMSSEDDETKSVDENETIICKKCGKIMKKGMPFCPDCGEDTKSVKLKKNIKKVILSFIALLGILFIIVPVINNYSLGVILKNHYKMNVQIVQTFNLRNDSQAFGIDKGSKLLLAEIDNCYSYVVIDGKRNLKEIKYNYPLYLIQQQIWNNGKKENTRCIKIFKEYIEEYGINFALDRELSDKYLEEITSDAKIISSSVAKDIIKDFIYSYLEENGAAKGEFKIAWKNYDSAAPEYYIVEETTRVFKWPISESIYEYYLDNYYEYKDTISALKLIYGQPYEQKNHFVVINSNFEEVGTFDTINAFLNSLLGEDIDPNNIY